MHDRRWGALFCIAMGVFGGLACIDDGDDLTDDWTDDSAYDSTYDSIDDELETDLEYDEALASADLEAAATCQRTVPARNTAALKAALTSARAGDCIEVADGSYGSPGTVSARGTSDAPIVVRAAHRGRATFTGTITLRGAAHVTLDGFRFTDGAKVTIENSAQCRITRSRFQLSAGGTWVVVKGTGDRNRIDHNDFGPHPPKGHFVQTTGTTTRTRIDRNHFHDMKPAGGNGGESVMIGCCGPAADYHQGKHVVERNLLVDCDGENEMIGIKSSGNVVRHNTIRRSRGFISLRAGRGNHIYGNYVLGEGKAGTGGIRLFEDDHVIYNNYVDAEEYPLTLTNGDAPGGTHAAIENVTVVFNTFVAHGQPVKIGGTGHRVPPSNTVFSNNLLQGDDTVIIENNPTDVDYAGNIAFRTSRGSIGVNKPGDQFRVADPRLQSGGGVLRPSSSSPVVDAAVGTFRFVRDDVDRRPRAGALDVGAFEWSSSQPQGAPLTPADVGPDAP